MFPVSLAVIDGIWGPDAASGDFLNAESKIFVYVFQYSFLALLIVCNLAEEVYKRYILLPVPWSVIVPLWVGVEVLALAQLVTYGILSWRNDEGVTVSDITPATFLFMSLLSCH